MPYPKITIFIVAAAMSTSTLVFANEEEGELEEAELFFELNDTDGDLGIHGFADGDEWKELEIEGPGDRELMKIKVKSSLKRQGVTELFFESAEPCFRLDEEECPDPFDTDVFFDRFPEGSYEIEAETLDGEEMENEIYLSHVIPAAPADVMVDGSGEDPVDAAENCDAEDLPEVTAPVTLSWGPVEQSHKAKWGDDDETGNGDEKIGLGEDGSIGIGGADDFKVLYYEVVVEIDESDFKSTTIVPANVYSVDLPEAITNLIGETEEGEFKFEILVRIDNGEDNPGNKSAMESCFIVTE